MESSLYAFVKPPSSEIYMEWDGLLLVEVPRYHPLVAEPFTMVQFCEPSKSSLKGIVVCADENDFKPKIKRTRMKFIL